MPPVSPLKVVASTPTMLDWLATRALHTIWQASGGVVNLTVDRKRPRSLVASMDAQLVEQQDSVLFSVEAFDEFRAIPFPRLASSRWFLREHSFDPRPRCGNSPRSNQVTMPSASTSGRCGVEELSLEVDSTIAGTLAAAGPLAYIGLGLGVIAFAALLVLGVIILRRGDDVWDDYDDEDDEDGSPIAAGPSGPPRDPAGHPPAQVEDAAALLLGTAPSPAPGPTAPPLSGPTAPPLSRNPPRNLRPGSR